MSGNIRVCSEVTMARMTLLYPKEQKIKKSVKDRKKEETARLKRESS